MSNEINIKIPGQILDYVDTKEHLLELFNYITKLKKQLEATENACIEWKKKYEEANKR